MKEYPSIINSSKAPKQECIAFDKLDGSNFRAKFNHKNGFCLFGTRTQLIDGSTPFWNRMINVFNNTLKNDLEIFFKRDKEFRNIKEIICFGEFFGDNSFAGLHDETEVQKIVLFDVMLVNKGTYKFLLPQEFIKKFNFIELPEVVYRGKLNDDFIQSVRNSESLNEGVICKGVERNGAFAGGVWQCKIKTQKYFDKLKGKFKEQADKYWE